MRGEHGVSWCVFAWAGGLACRRGSRTGVRYPDPSGWAQQEGTRADGHQGQRPQAAQRPGRHGSCSTTVPARMGTALLSCVASPASSISLPHREWRFSAPDEIAAAAVYLASDHADYVHGTTLTVDGGRLAA